MFTAENSKKQDEAFAALKEEYARLEAKEKEMRKALNLPEEGAIDLNDMPQEVLGVVDICKDRAKRAGAARAAQFSAEFNQVIPNKIPGARRQGILRV